MGNQGELKQLWQDLVHSQGWELFRQLVQDRLQKNSINRWKAQARDRDISNGYWAGYHDACDAILRLPKEEVEKLGQA